ncbi:MAG TPA: glycosyltransferase [Gemmatimonadaceae bacterium]|jgi:chlorobactene glucosyltransferase
MIATVPWGTVALTAAPWLLVPAVILWRAKDTVTLAEYPSTPPSPAPPVSVIIPARNEARNIEACVRSILAATWPSLEIIVIDDHSEDGTGSIAHTIGDSRVTVIDNPDLPDGWFGKQWACHNGARVAKGSFLLFTDADTRHAPELIVRSMNAMRERRADLFTIGGAQTMATFWERLLQPQVFGMLLARFGGTERVSRTRNPYSKIANGQFMLVRREVYDRASGHEAVRSHVAEDLRLAQEWTRLGYSVQMVAAFDYMSTRMYEGFGEIWRGWGKNVWAAGRDTVGGGAATRAVLRVLSPLAPLWEVAPAVALLLGLAGIASPAVGAWGALTFAIGTLFWIVLRRVFRAPVWYAVLHPVAACVLAALFASASWRGARVEWKGREYVSQ